MASQGQIELADYRIDLEGQPHSRVCLYTKLNYYQHPWVLVAERDFTVAPAPPPASTPPASDTSAALDGGADRRPRPLPMRQGALSDDATASPTASASAGLRLDAATFACSFYVHVGSFTTTKKHWIAGTVTARRTAGAKVKTQIAAFRYRRLQA